MHLHRLPTTVLLTIMLALPLALGAQAQTPATTVKDADGNVVLQSNGDGGLLAPGEFGTGTIPATGAGTRFMWHPAKGALRAGRVFDGDGQSNGSTFWNNSNVGERSVAMGQNTQATANDATALGDATQATDSDALAVGLETVASAKQAIALGDDTEANESDAVALGFETEASGSQSTAMGKQTVASGNQSTAFGNQTKASGIIATAMGSNTVADGIGATSIGLGTQANGQGTLAVGQCNSTDNVRFVVGGGSYSFSGSCDSRSDAMTVDSDGNVTISGTLTESSDRRLKTDINSLDRDVLAKLSRLRPVRYAFKNQDAHASGKQIGLIAQDVQKEFPELVREGADGYLSLAYPKFTAVLLKGLQEQQATIDSLKGRIRSLETVKERQDRLAEQVAALQDGKSSADTGTLPAGGGLSTLLALLLTLGGFGVGLFWRQTGA